MSADTEAAPGWPRCPVVGVMGSGTDPHAERALPLGRRLAELGVHLLTGGGVGAMESVCRGFHQVEGRIGRVIGIVPCQAADPLCRPRQGYPNRWVEIPILTHLPLSGDEGEDPLSRNHINVLSSALVIALPGGAGTASEVRLALRYRRPVLAHLEHRDQIPDLPAEVPWVPGLDEVEARLCDVLGIG